MATDEGDTADPVRGTTAADRVADVLLAFSAGEPRLGVTALSRQLGLSKAVVHRILQSLVAKGLLQYAAGTRAYDLGPAAAMLGARMLSQLDIRDISRPELIELRSATGETTTLSLLVNDGRAYVEQYVSPQEITMTVELGRSYPLHAGASSQAILANLDGRDRDRVLDGALPALTAGTITDRGTLLAALEEVRRRGYAATRGERQPGAASVAAPIFAAGGRVAGAISVCGPLYRFDDPVIARLVPMVVAVARRISRRFAGADR
ncbi:IclR family transcriptional regulator [Acuticoccus sediminis]|uniref:IclR family transcriptional regulator n=1 Tax=Acuticoccus sediminis TaxID=2184697 RepID=UPI001CFD008E|nr:IclR family transcriptional regulator [Acuticoccus sediminis]